MLVVNKAKDKEMKNFRLGMVLKPKQQKKKSMTDIDLMAKEFKKVMKK